ncbi:MAG TPA: peptidase C39 family protein, partial [Archangium sp.]|nr:peptidase C39 family protein [Archangium sp.]
EGKLTGSPVRSSDGHLLVVKGFTPQGDVICNDPAFRGNEAVEVTYKREELWRAWRHSRGAAYVLWPSGTELPAALQGTLVSNPTP